MKSAFIAARIAFVLAVSMAITHAQNCPELLSGGQLPPQHQRTNDFYFSASDAQGAVGDVVGIELSVVIERLHTTIGHIQCVLAYNENMVEPLGEPIYSEEFDSFAWMPFFVDLGGSSDLDFRSRNGKKGLLLVANVQRGGEDFFASGQSRLLGTMYFRLTGEAGEAAAIEFVDNEFLYPNRPGVSEGCISNALVYDPLPGESLNFTAYSNRHVTGTIRIVPGEPTQTQLPPVAPDARIYDLPITPAFVNAHFLFIDGNLACPEAADFNEDTTVNVADPVAILNHLFLSGPDSSSRDVFCNTQ